MQMYGKNFGIPNIKQYLTVCSIKKNLQGFGIVDFLPYICIIERHSHSLIHTHSFTHIECFSKQRDIYQAKGDSIR